MMRFLLILFLSLSLHARSAITVDSLMRLSDICVYGTIVDQRFIEHTAPYRCEFDIRLHQTTRGGKWPPDSAFNLRPGNILRSIEYRQRPRMRPVVRGHYWSVFLVRSDTGWKLTEPIECFQWEEYPSMMAAVHLPFRSNDTVWFADAADPDSGISIQTRTYSGEYTITCQYSQKGVMIFKSKVNWRGDQRVIVRESYYKYNGRLRRKLRRRHDPNVRNERGRGRNVYWTFYDHGHPTFQRRVSYSHPES